MRQDGVLQQGAGDQSLISGLLGALSNGEMDFEKLEHQLLEAALQQSKGNVLAAARLLGMSGPQVRYRLKKLDLI